MCQWRIPLADTRARFSTKAPSARADTRSIPPRALLRRHSRLLPATRQAGQPVVDRTGMSSWRFFTLRRLPFQLAEFLLNHALHLAAHHERGGDLHGQALAHFGAG